MESTRRVGVVQLAVSGYKGSGVAIRWHMFPTLDLNIQFGCCFAVFIVWFLCLFPLRHAQAKAQGGLNNSDPRRQYGEIDGYGRRALAAHNNTLEGFVFFSFTLVANYFGNGHQTAASILAVIYAICRVIYAPLYIMDYPSLRSAVWMVSILCIMSLFILPFATPATPGFVLSYNY